MYRFLVSRGHQRTTHGRVADRSDFAADLAAAGARYFPGFADDPGSAEGTLVAIIGLVDASVLRWLDRRGENRDRLIDRLTTQCWLIIEHHLHESGIHVNPTQVLPRPGKAHPSTE